MNAYLAMTEYQDGKEFMDELTKVIALVDDNVEVKDDTMILSVIPR